jgi:hypothetical protein
MNYFLTGSINLSKLIEKAKSGHSAFTKSAKDGNVYVNIKAWFNEEPNEFGQHMSFLLNSTKDLQEEEGKVYFGNAKKVDTSQPIKPKDIDDDLSSVPIKEKKETFIDTKESSDLPF